jgi:hypothetical protein
VAFPNGHSAAAVALWITTTHALPAFECAPRLVATSPDKRCGRTIYYIVDIDQSVSVRPRSGGHKRFAEGIRWSYRSGVRCGRPDKHTHGQLEAYPCRMPPLTAMTANPQPFLVNRYVGPIQKS